MTDDGTQAPRVTADALFAMLPEWVLYADVSAQAVRLYAVLHRYANSSSSGSAYPSRRLLAEHLRVRDEKTVDRAVRELVELGALTVHPRVSASGDRTSNSYVVRSLPFGGVGASMPPPGGVGAPTGGGMGRRGTRATLNENSPSPSTSDRASAREPVADPRAVACPVCRSHHRPSDLCGRGVPPDVAVLREAARGGRRPNRKDRRR